MTWSGRSSRRLSTRAALALLGAFAVVALVAWGLSARSAGSPGATGPVTGATSPGAAGVTSPGAARVTAPGSPGARTGRPSPTRTAPPGSATTRGSAIPQGTATPPGAGAPIRAKALYVLAVLDATGSAPAGYVGGRRFLNDTRGGTTALPHQDGSGAVIAYHEYDVNPHRSGVNRGPQRLVVGSDGSAWTTADHYVTWQRLR